MPQRSSSEERVVPFWFLCLWPGLSGDLMASLVFGAGSSGLDLREHSGLKCTGLCWPKLWLVGVDQKAEICHKAWREEIKDERVKGLN